MIAACLALAAGLVGCDKEPEPVPYLEVPTDPPTKASTSGPNAFDAYADLARRAERVSTVPLDARDTPATRRRSVDQLSAILLGLEAATKRDCAFRFEATGPFDERPHQMGWLYLGRAIGWRVEAAAKNREWFEAARWAVVGTTFGLDLSGGSMSDATAGFGALDGTRRALAPHIGLMDPGALAELASGLDAALARLPEPATTIENEGRLMLAAISALQDAHQAGKLKEFADKLYGAPRDAVMALEDMPGIERSLFFQSLFDEQKLVVSRLLEAASVPGSRRGPLTTQLSGRAQTIADQFFSAGEPWLRIRDRVLARTRLFALSARIAHDKAVRGTVPESLAQYPAQSVSDPYTGLPFGYLGVGQDFLVYSYGMDGKDDRGDTDGARLEPDLLLEDSKN